MSCVLFTLLNILHGYSLPSLIPEHKSGLVSPSGGGEGEQSGEKPGLSFHSITYQPLSLGQVTELL